MSSVSALPTAVQAAASFVTTSQCPAVRTAGSFKSKVQATRRFRRCDFVVRLKPQRVARPRIVRPRAESTSQNLTQCSIFGEGIASGKHVAQTTDQSARTGERLTERTSNKMADSSIRISLLLFRLTLLRKFHQHQGEIGYPRSRSVN